MREHIYRAWHREEKEMYWFDITWGNYNQGGGWIGMVPMTEGALTHWPDNRTCIAPESVELMEYTEKDDKMGGRIFEGDILRYDNTAHPLSGGLYLIEWSADECSFICERQKPFNYLLPCVWCECEVVGNIYENPELLNVDDMK
jgi:uncharacterized phage protein (TIGR01671 family)